MIFRRLHNRDHQMVMKYLSQEPEFNLFIIGDIENFGYESDFQTIWGMVDKNQVKGVLLRYYSSFIPYALDQTILKKFIPLIKLGAKVLSGKKEIIDVIKQQLDPEIILAESNDYFTRLRGLNQEMELREPGTDWKIKKAGVDDVDRMLELRSQIEEFKNLPANREQLVNKFRTGSGRAYYVENDRGEVVTSASTTAENSNSAMIVGVATLPRYRRRGLATNCVYRLSKELLAEKKTPCLFYDNPEAGKIYRKIGYQEIGMWSILRLNI